MGNKWVKWIFLMMFLNPRSIAWNTNKRADKSYCSLSSSLRGVSWDCLVRDLSWMLIML